MKPKRTSHSYVSGPSWSGQAESNRRRTHPKGVYCHYTMARHVVPLHKERESRNGQTYLKNFTKTVKFWLQSGGPCRNHDGRARRQPKPRWSRISGCLIDPVTGRSAEPIGRGGPPACPTEQTDMDPEAKRMTQNFYRSCEVQSNHTKSAPTAQRTCQAAPQCMERGSGPTPDRPPLST